MAPTFGMKPSTSTMIPAEVITCLLPIPVTDKRPDILAERSGSRTPDQSGNGRTQPLAEDATVNALLVDLLFGHDLAHQDVIAHRLDDGDGIAGEDDQAGREIEFPAERQDLRQAEPAAFPTAAKLVLPAREAITEPAIAATKMAPKRRKPFLK